MSYIQEMIDSVNVNINSVAFRGWYQFLNEDDFKILCKKLNYDPENINMIKVGDLIFIKFFIDLSDLGNDIGSNIGEYINTDKNGYRKDDLFGGINHGISLIDGTHFK